MSGNQQKASSSNSSSNPLLNSLSVRGAEKGIASLFTDAGAEAVGSTILADGTPGLLLADGSVVAQPGAWSFSGAGGIGGIGAAGNAILPVAGGLGALNLLTQKGKVKPVRGAAQGAASGAAIGSYFGLPGAAIGAGIGGLTGLAKSMLYHESTKDRSNRRWNELPKGDEAWETFKRESLAQSLSPTASHWDIGDDKAQAPIDELVNSYGIAKDIGPKWLQYSPEQKKQYVTALVNNDLINNQGGEFLITDAAKANSLLPALPDTLAQQTTQTTRQTAAPKKRRPAYVPMPAKQVYANAGPNIAGGPVQDASPKTVSDFAKAYITAMNRRSNKDLSNPLNRVL